MNPNLTGQELIRLDLDESPFRIEGDQLIGKTPTGKEMGIDFNTAERLEPVQLAPRDEVCQITECYNDEVIPEQIVELIAKGKTDEGATFSEPPDALPSVSRNLVIDLGGDDYYILNGVGFTTKAVRDYPDSIFYPPDFSKKVKLIRSMGTTRILYNGNEQNHQNNSPLGAFSSGDGKKKFEITSQMREITDGIFHTPIPVAWGRIGNSTGRGEFMIYKRPKAMIKFHHLAQANLDFIYQHKEDPLFAEIAAFNLMLDIALMHRVDVAHWQLHLGNVAFLTNGANPWVYIGDWETATDLSRHIDKKPMGKNKTHMKTHKFLGPDRQMYELLPKSVAKVFDASRAIRAFSSGFNGTRLDDPSLLFDAISSVVSWGIEGYLRGLSNDKVLPLNSGGNIQSRKHLIYMGLMSYASRFIGGRGSPGDCVAEITQSILAKEYANLDRAISRR